MESQLKSRWQSGRVLWLLAALLLAAMTVHPGLLRVWTDEMFTLDAIAQPVPAMLDKVGSDIHPPLYFLLLKWWTALPLPADTAGRMRLFSVLWAAVAACALDRFFLRRLAFRQRAIGLLLWCGSPTVLLYGRMGRSYLMQAALAIIVVGCAERLLRSPDRKRLAWSAAAFLALLYTHYVPGIAMLAAFHLVAWRRIEPRKLAVMDAAVALGYLPWLVTLASALGRWGAGSGFPSDYRITGSLVLEQVVKIGYAAVSFSIGESFPPLAFVCVPLFFLLAAAGARRYGLRRSAIPAMLIVAAVIGYAGVARWVSYPFIPARLLWLLPFVTVAVTYGAGARVWVAIPLFAAALTGWYGYWTRTGYLNPGYAVPLDEVAAQIRTHAIPGAILLADTFNTDYGPVARLVGTATPLLPIETGRERELLVRGAAAPEIWVLRNTRDISPGGLTARIEALCCQGRRTETFEYLEIPAWQRAMLRLVSGADPPAHFYRLTHCTKP